MTGVVGARGFTVILALLAACEVPPQSLADAGAPDARQTDGLGLGTDEAQVARCLACHQTVSSSWQQPSSHKLLLGCPTCHAATGKPAGPGHQQRPACSGCHSSVAHPTTTSACVTCHDVHGSSNAFLIRSTIALPDGKSASVRLTRAEGASSEGLVRSGADAGKGLCEVCHTRTRYYRASGQAATHFTSYCIACHSHAAGFRPN